MKTWRWHGSVTAISGALRQAGIVDRHVAPAEQRLALLGDDVLDDLLHLGAQRRVLRHEDEADRVVAGLRQGEAEPLRLLGEEGVRDLHQDAGAVAHQRVGADGAAMLEVLEDPQPVLDDPVRLLVLQVDDEADAAGVALVRRVVEARGGRSGGTAAAFGRRRTFAPPVRNAPLLPRRLHGSPVFALQTQLAVVGRSDPPTLPPRSLPGNRSADSPGFNLDLARCPLRSPIGQ